MAKKRRKKLGGLWFWFMAVLALTKDTLKIVSLVLAFAFAVMPKSVILGILGAGVGASYGGDIGAAAGGVVGAGVGLVPVVGEAFGITFAIGISLVVFIFSLVIHFTIIAYLKIQGVKFTSRVLATVAVSTIIECIPFVSKLVPATTFCLFWTRRIHNKGAKAAA